MPTMRSLLLAGVSLVGLTTITVPVATAQGSLAETAEVLAHTGGDVPGLPGVTYRIDFDSPVIDGGGGVLFRARFEGAGISSANDRALFVADAAGNVTKLIQGGDAAPGLPGLVLQTSSGLQGLQGGSLFSATGRALWTSSVNGAGVTPADDRALFVDTAGGPDLLAREGDPAPGTAGAVFATGTFSAFSSLSQQWSSINSGDRVLFRTSLTGGDVVGATNNDAWYSGTHGALEPIVRTGDTVLGTETIEALGFIAKLNSQGKIVFDAKLLTTGGGSATTATDATLWMYTPGLGIQLVLREDDPAPGTVGARFGGWQADLGNCGFNASGEFLLITSLIGGDTVAGVNDRALYRCTAGGQTLVARAGDPVPGTDTQFKLWHFFNSVMNDNGTVFSQSYLTGGTSTPDDDSAMCIHRNGSFEVVARQGDPIASMPGFHFGDFVGKIVMLNNLDQALFLATVVDDNTLQQFNTWWSWSPAQGLDLVFMPGDVMEIAPGLTGTLNSVNGIQFSNGDTAPLSLAHDGSYAFRANYSSASGAGSAIVRGSIGSPWSDLGQGLAGTHGVPVLDGSGDLSAGSSVTLTLGNAIENAAVGFVLGLSQLNANFKGGTLVPNPDFIITGLTTNGSGDLSLTATWPAGVPSGFVTYFQEWITDPAGPKGFSASNGLAGTAP